MVRVRLRGALGAWVACCGCNAGSATESSAAWMPATSTDADDTAPPPTTGDATTSSGAVPGESDATDAGETTATPDVARPVADPIRIAVISDLNGSYGSTDYGSSVHAGVAAVIALAPDVVLSTGDMVAGQQAGLDYAAMWAGFHAAVSDPLADAGLPFAITPGNHDASGYPAFLTERELFVAQWTPRKPTLEYLDDAAYPLRYSFAVGNAMFVALDDTTVGPLAAEQMAWLEDQLVDGAAYPTKIIYGHVPLWPFAQGREDEVIGDDALEQLLLDHDVSLFVSGHHHAYYPGRRGDLRLAGTACLGSGPRALIGVGATSARAILVIDVDAGGTITALDAYAEPDFTMPIDRAGLPTALSYGGVTIDRDDQR